MKAIFLDRDGTLVDDPGYVHKISDFKLIDGTIVALKLLEKFKLFIITNQSGIGREYYTKKDYEIFNNHLIKVLDKHNIKIEKTYVCPHTPEDNCECRKPNTKFMHQAKKEFDIDLEKSWVIGDHPCDAKLAKNVGARSVYVLTGHGKKHLEETKPDFITKDILKAAKYINRQEKILDCHNLLETVEDIKKNKKTIVTCNGCFDIIHAGHIKFLEEAKQQGDVLIIGLNSDTSIKQNKGPNRPINNQNNRALILAALEIVDYVTIFEEKNPLELLAKIKPDIHVNGEEYGEDCIEASLLKKNGGKLYLVKSKKGYSTTSIIKKIKDNIFKPL